MARKDFDRYFLQISKQYIDLQKVLQEMSEEADKKMIEPERLEQLKATIQPVKNSYETLNYIRYLLDKPTRKSKRSRYESQSKKILSKCGDKIGDNVLKRNEEIINKIKPN